MHRDLLFDLDQTLLDFHASEHIALKKVMETNRLAFTEERYELFKYINKSLWLEFEKGIITKPELFEMRFRRLFEKCGCDTEEMDLQKINSDFIDCMSQNGILMEGALEFLKKINDNIPDARKDDNIGQTVTVEMYEQLPIDERNYLISYDEQTNE